MTREQHIIHWLYAYGHFWSPGALSNTLVSAADLPRLRLSDAVVQLAIVSAQEWFEPCIMEGRAKAGLHRHEPNVDGDPQQGFDYLVTLDRCGMPDYPDPTAMTLPGRYGPACLGKLLLAHRFAERVTTEDEKIVRRNLIEWIEGADLRIVRAQSSPSEAHFWEIVQNQGGSILARHMLQQGVSCRRTEGWYDPRSFSSQGMRTAVITHEVGHGLGMPHTSARDPDTGELATLYSMIHQASQRRNGRYNKADHAVLRRLGYAVTDKPRDVDDDGPPDPVDNVRMILEIPQDVEKGKYTLIGRKV